MSETLLQRTWRVYRARKSVLGIVTDFLFLAIVIVALIPPLRFGVQVRLARMGLSAPKPHNKIEYVSHPISVKTADGRDTLIMGNIERTTLYNFGGTWSATSCAELRSINEFAKLHADSIDVIFISDEEPEDALAYLKSHKYSLKTLFYDPDDLSSQPEEMHELMLHCPSSLLLDESGRVLAKTSGAALWSGDGLLESLVQQTYLEELR